MRGEGIGGPVVALLFLLAVIIGLVAYIGRDNHKDEDVPEWEETAPMVADSTETKVVFESSENIESQEETPRDNGRKSTDNI